MLHSKKLIDLTSNDSLYQTRDIYQSLFPSMSLSHLRSPVLLKVFEMDACGVFRYHLASSKSYGKSLLGDLNLPRHLC